MWSLKKTFPAFILLIVGLLVTTYASFQVKQNIEGEAVRRFAFTCDQIALKIHERLIAYQMILRGGASFFAGAESVDRQQWRTYIDTLRADQNIPGVQGIGFSQIIPPDQLDAHIARIRREGFPEYTVWPAGKRAVYTSIIYLEPFRDRNLRAFGYDMYSEPVRRAAMEQARDSDRAALTGKVELVQETGKDVQAGTLIYVPVYRKHMPTDTVEQRRAALLGWVYSPYRMTDMMSGILGAWEKQEGQRVDLHIYDGLEAKPGALLFDSDNATNPGVHSLFSQRRTIDFNGHQWSLIFDEIARDYIDYSVAWHTLIGGFALCILLFGLMLSRINMRTNANRIANELTATIRERERVLQESEGRYRALFDSSPDALFVLDASGRILDANAIAQRRYGYARDEFLSMNIRSQIPEENLDKVAGHLKEAIEQGTQFEWLHRYKDGLVVPVEVSARGFMLGAERCVLASVRDIAERKQAEHALQRESEKNRALLHNASDGIHILNADGNLVEVSDSFCAMLGYRRDEMIGMNISQWDDQFSAVEFSAIIRPLFETPVRAQIERRHRHKDGTIFDVEVSVFPLELEGKPMLFCSSRDITERKRLERELQQLNQTLAQQIEDEVAKNRAKDLLLIQQSRLAAMGEMIGNIAHQWRQPINALTLLLSNIKDAYDYNELTREYLDDEVKIGQNLIQKMSGTIDDFRNFFKPDKKKISFFVDDEVQEAINLVSETLKHNNISIVFDRCSDPCQVMGYPNEFAQVVMNVLVNAKESIVGKGKSGEISIHAEVGTDKAILSIHDNGGGIPEEILPKVFDPYITTKEKGTGIGLYMSKMIMNEMDGDITIRNIGDGVEVLLELPLVVIPKV